MFGLFKKKSDDVVRANTFHYKGLPLAEKTPCNITLKPDGLLISGGGSSFVLSDDQILKIERYHDDKPAPGGGTWSIAHLLVNYKDGQGQLTSITFGHTTGQVKIADIKNENKIIEVVNQRIQSRQTQNTKL